MLKGPLKINNQLATINNKAIADKFIPPSSWGLRVSWHPAFNAPTISGIAGIPIGVPTANPNTADYCTELAIHGTQTELWPRVEWTNTGSGYYTGISAAYTQSTGYFNLYNYGSYYQWPNGVLVNYFATDSGGYRHPLPETVEFRWKCPYGTIYFEVFDQNREDTLILFSSNWNDDGRPEYHDDFSGKYNIVYPTASW